MTDKELLYIKTIAEERNISLAARKLFMTQPALSHCLISLEKETGTPLFVRTPGGAEYDLCGRVFLQHGRGRESGPQYLISPPGTGFKASGKGALYSGDPGPPDACGQ